MILTKKEILAQVENNNIILDGVYNDQIKDNSVDVSLYKEVLVHKESFINTLLGLQAKQKLSYYASSDAVNIIDDQIKALNQLANKVVSTVGDWHIVDITEPITFVNGLFVLGAVEEWVGTRSNTDLCCEFRLKSTPARLGLDHAFASWIETGYFSRLCLELTFNVSVELQKGSLIGQYIFHKTTDQSVDYTEKGSYQSSKDLESIKKDWSIQEILPALKKYDKQLASTPIFTKIKIKK